MKVRTLIALLSNLSPDNDVFVCGMDRFYIYSISSKSDNPFISFDIDQFDHSEFSVTKKGFKVYDSLTVSTQYEIELARKEKINDSLKQSKSILNALDKTK